MEQCFSLKLWGQGEKQNRTKQKHCYPEDTGENQLPLGKGVTQKKSPDWGGLHVGPRTIVWGEASLRSPCSRTQGHDTPGWSKCKT